MYHFEKSEMSFDMVANIFGKNKDAQLAASFDLDTLVSMWDIISDGMWCGYALADEEKYDPIAVCRRIRKRLLYLCRDSAFKQVGNCEQGGPMCCTCGYVGNSYIFHGTCDNCGMTRDKYMENKARLLSFGLPSFH